ncbi:hypothetical protein [Nocardioides sp.]|uniref:hypothetical protein n=1 Tax=Nocardioides sp. TaxID=35761 RepID=UPI002B27ACD4|nr:hypothetical protein [Nocardioides sp.]
MGVRRDGEAGPGPSYLDDHRGSRNHRTTRNAVFAAWNMPHVGCTSAARRLEDAGGVPAHGNVTSSWDLSQPDDPNPEYRCAGAPTATVCPPLVRLAGDRSWCRTPVPPGGHRARRYPLMSGNPVHTSQIAS